MSVRFTPTTIEGNIYAVNNLLEVNSGVLQFGGTAVKDTTGDMGPYNLVFTSNNDTVLGLSDFGGSNKYFGAGKVNANLVSTVIGGEDITGLGTEFRSGAAGISFVFQQSGFSGVQFDTVRQQMEADCIVSDDNAMTDMGWRVKYNVGSVLYMQGFTGEVVNFKDATGTNWLEYIGDTQELDIGNNAVALTLDGTTIGFFGSSVAQQSASTVAAAVTVADLVTALQTWQTALTNYGLINFV